MKQLLEGLASFRTKIANIFHYEATNSFNKTEYHFHGPVNFIEKRSKRATQLPNPEILRAMIDKLYKSF